MNFYLIKILDEKYFTKIYFIYLKKIFSYDNKKYIYNVS